jgi:hypothetical protein
MVAQRQPILKSLLNSHFIFSKVFYIVTLQYARGYWLLKIFGHFFLCVSGWWRVPPRALGVLTAGSASLMTALGVYVYVVHTHTHTHTHTHNHTLTACVRASTYRSIHTHTYICI